MKSAGFLPRVLIIDDLFGRVHRDRRNEERASLCGQFLLADVTGDEAEKATPQKIVDPIAEAVFFRGQQPSCATVGDNIQNDLHGVLAKVRKGWTEREPDQAPWSMVLLDLCFYTGEVTAASTSQRGLGMPEGRTDDDPAHYFGIEILRALHKSFPDLPVAILSSMPREGVSRDFSEHGALGFLPREDSKSPELLQQYLWRHGLLPDASGEIVGLSHLLLLALRSARRAATNHHNVLIRGESGTGKELFARYIGRQRPNWPRTPFIVVPAPILTPELFSSELFGIESRVATEVNRRSGLITSADSGDLFFDEIGDMLPEVQAGILRVLEDRCVTPVGGRQSHKVDVRFLSATNADIEERSASGTFRADLLYRLREGGTILLPPLRYRKQDIPLLADRFVREVEREHPEVIHRTIEKDAFEKLSSHDWPGNIRELRTCIMQAVLQNPDVEHLVVDHIRFSACVSNYKSVAPLFLKQHLDNDTSPIFENVPSLLDSIEISSIDPLSFAGKLELLDSAWAKFMVRLLRAAIEATRKRTPDNPKGEIFPLSAIKYLTGRRDLKAWQAYDIIKRISLASPQLSEELMADPVLGDILKQALHSRRRK